MKEFSKETGEIFEYAIETENKVLFDTLAEQFCKDSQKLKNELLLLTAEKAKIPAFVERAIELGGDISYTDENWNTLLHHAAASCHPKVVQFFIDKGLSLEARNKRGSTPLIVATSASCSLKVIQKLLEAGADINAKTAFGESVLIMAAKNNPYADITRFFIEQGLSVKDRDNYGYTPFLNAAMNQKNTDVLDSLVDAGSDIHERAPNGDTAFHLAAMNWDPSPAEWLKKYFSTSEKNNDGETCLERALSKAGSGRTLSVYLKKMQLEHLMLAYRNTGYGVFEALKKAGYDLNLRDENGATALMHAAKESQAACVVELIDQGADEHCKDDKNRNVLHYAAANTDSQVYEMTNMFLENADDIAEAKDCLGHTPDYYLTHTEEF